ncbi:MAG TPA: putative zinc-binding metallopeptidase [Fimbriimonadaceae bacterium]
MLLANSIGLIGLCEIAAGIKAPTSSQASHAKEIARQVKAQFHVQIIFSSKQQRFKDVVVAWDSPIDWRKMDRFATLLSGELRRYGSAYRRKLAPSKVMLVDYVFLRGSKISALTDNRIRTIFFSIDGDTPVLMEHVIHHELFHSMVYKDQEKWGKLVVAILTLNPPGFHYGKVAWDLKKNAPHPAPGFASLYAEVNPSEDLAEMYAYYSTRSQRSELVRWASGDVYLKRKLAVLLTFLKGEGFTIDGARL